uniref:Uncharacterized protein n=1 Tax=Oryza nivara TaxID=4536 RepID=A0A0E0I297_ORYNI
MVKPAAVLLLLYLPLLVTPTRIGLSRNPFVPPPNSVPTIDRTEMGAGPRRRRCGIASPFPPPQGESG